MKVSFGMSTIAYEGNAILSSLADLELPWAILGLAYFCFGEMVQELWMKHLAWITSSRLMMLRGSDPWSRKMIQIPLQFIMNMKTNTVILSYCIILHNTKLTMDEVAQMAAKCGHIHWWILKIGLKDPGPSWNHFYFWYAWSHGN